MQKGKHVSFLVHPFQHKEVIWSKNKLGCYQNDTIELRLGCHYVSQESGELKPINLEFGEKNVYKIKEGNLKGKFSLTFSTMTSSNSEDQYRLQKNNKILDIVVENAKQLRQILAKKCILTSFHEDYHMEKLMSKRNKSVSYFVAIKRSTKGRFAVKAFSKDFLIQEQRRENLKNEIRTLRSLNQESIIHLQEVHETQNSIYLVMDYFSGGQLQQRMNHTIFSEKDIKLFMYNLLKALHYLNLNKITLTNLSPKNILFKRKESNVEFVIFDFSEVQFDQKLTQRKFEINLFQAPEIQENLIISGKCDTYSAGVIFYKLVSGDSPEEAFDYDQQVQKNNLDFFYNLKIQKTQQSLIRKMIRANPKIRYNAEKCLKHRYFKQILKPEDLLTKLKKNENQSTQMLQDTAIKISEEESANSVESQSSGSVNERSNHTPEKKKYSKFQQFCSDMENMTHHQIFKKGGVSLLKLAVQNSYLKKQGSKDDNFIDQNLKSVSGEIIKKRNSLNIQS